ncbi:adenylosuccinate lyase [Flagellimonas hymeniacidonis]|uniref:Adenylosuccinate lyase n=1 Tax=Flagellimonas hymeniacidonis TaxID=2603628 RepID=A0A5C8V3N7_9FLAO|nr:adenylosuccinate lyase [Flagellimonas hymeniacidonis]TXN35388.1 adenylosuccinate lyase [Flagellimonas hymeniacidonis]
MTEKQLHIALNSERLSKEKINDLVCVLTVHPELTGPLLQEVFDQDKTDSFNASWVFDHLMRKKLDYLLPHLENFTKGLADLTSESIIRPMAHTCELTMEAYFKTKDPVFVQNLTPEQLERIMTVCFDWLIGSHKVAAKVFAMSSLYYLGMKYDWVHPELKMVLEQNNHNDSAGYKARAKKTLMDLKKLGF